MPADLPWFEMPSPFDTEAGKVLMLESPWASRGELRAQLLDESYPKPFVIDDGERRSRSRHGTRSDGRRSSLRTTASRGSRA
jgi:hypothetical protein